MHLLGLTLCPGKVKKQSVVATIVGAEAEYRATRYVRRIMDNVSLGRG